MPAERRLRKSWGRSVTGTVVICAGMALTTCGCSRDPQPVASAPLQPSRSFEAARARCSVTVAETADVQRCMRTQGWVYRLPWE